MSQSTATARFMLIRELFDLARRQRTALEVDALEEFQSILDDRAGIIAQLQELTIADASAELPENVIRFPGALQQDDEDQLAIETLLRGVMEHDRHNEQLLAERMEALRVELPNLEAGRRAAARYAIEPSQHFIDRVS